MRALGQLRRVVEAVDAREELVARLPRRAALREERRVVRALHHAERRAAVREQVRRHLAVLAVVLGRDPSRLLVDLVQDFCQVFEARCSVGLTATAAM